MRRKVNRLLIIAVGMGLSISSYSQVANNGIEQRIRLFPEEIAIHSTTAESTVEWTCINKKLTNKCIVYHNDQWFTFSVPDPGSYYINISNQVCRDLYGIQMIIIEGNPCDTENYIIKRCISKLRMDDMFVALGMLQANQLYLLNIDGFLGDYCSFDIQLSKKPKGLPETIKLTADSLMIVSAEEQLVHLRWETTDSVLSVTRNFDVYRKEAKEKKFSFLTSKNIQSNAAGSFLHNYEHIDTLVEEGVFDYIVLAQSDTSSATIFRQHVQRQKNKPKPVNHIITLSLTFSKEGPVEILVLDPVADWVLKRYSEEFSFKNPILQVSAYSLYEKGLRDIKIKVKNLKTREVNNFRFVAGETGWEFRQDKR